MTENSSYIKDLNYLIKESELDIAIDNDVDPEGLFEILVDNIEDI